MKLFIKGEEFIPITKVPRDSYVKGMEEDSAILVVYKEPHIIDTSTDLELKPGAKFYVEEMEFEVESYGYNDEAMQYLGVIRARNTSENKAYQCFNISTSIHDDYGDIVGWTTMDMYNQRDGSNFFIPGDISNDIQIQDSREFAYYKPEVQDFTDYQRLNPDISSNLMRIEEGSYKSYNNVAITIESYIDNIARIKINNELPDSMIFLPTTILPICDEWGRSRGDFSLSNNVKLFYDSPMGTDCYFEPGSLLHLAFDNAEIHYKHEIDPNIDLALVENSEVMSGDFKFKFINKTFENNNMTLNLEVTNTKDFDIKLPEAFKFHIFDPYGIHIAEMMGYVGGTISAGETRSIQSGIDIFIPDDYYIQFDWWLPLNTENMIIPIVPSNEIFVEPGVTAYLEEFYVDGTTTQSRMYFKNNSGAEINTEYTADVLDNKGNILWSPIYVALQLQDGRYTNPNCGIGGTEYYTKAYAITNIRRKESE